MLYLIPWAVAGWLRLETHHAAQVDASRRIEAAVRGISAARMRVDDQAYDRAFVEQSTGNRKLDDRVRRLKVEALHAFKRDFARHPGHLG